MAAFKPWSKVQMHVQDLDRDAKRLEIRTQLVQTAMEGFKTGGFKEGQTVFVVGGAGGVGALAVQLAKHFYEASLVVATTSSAKVEFVRSLGADKVVDYTKTRYEEVEDKFDLLYDTIETCIQNQLVVKIQSWFDPPAPDMNQDH
ncbi:hypothetical protein C3L33_23513, partial [Rhododendron williamsianum]